jgi:hypothetical protein
VLVVSIDSSKPVDPEDATRLILCMLEKGSIRSTEDLVFFWREGGVVAISGDDPEDSAALNTAKGAFIGVDYGVNRALEKVLTQVLESLESSNRQTYLLSSHYHPGLGDRIRMWLNKLRYGY